MAVGQKNIYPEDSTTTKSPCSRKRRIKQISSMLSTITVEPMVICYILALIITGLSTQNLNLEKACRVNLKLDKRSCDAITSRNSSSYNKSDEVAVQKIVAEANIWKFLLQCSFSVIILAFIGSWSDRNGRRKACVITPLLGEICTVSSLLLCTYFFYELPMEVSVFSESIASFLGGSMHVFMVGIFTIVCSNTTLDERTVRVGVIHVLVQLGVTLALALSGLLINRLGFYGVYGVALLLYTSALLYGIIFIKDQKRPSITTQKKIGFLKDFFDVRYLRNTFKVTFMNEDQHKQKRIRLIMIVAMLVVGPLHGEMGVLYLYTRYKFHWNEIDFGIFYSMCAIIHLAAATVSLFIFSKLLKMHDALIGSIAAVSKIAGSLVFAFAPTGTVFYMGVGADLLSSILFITMRSIVTKQVTSTELGKMNSVFGVAEAIVPLFYGPIYSATYKATITFFPGTFYVISSVLTVPVLGIYVWLYKHRNVQSEEKPEDIEKMQNLLVK